MVSKLFHPLRLYCFLNIVGDVFVVLSGVSYGNPARAVSAIIGSISHLGGLAFPKKVVFGMAMTDVVMRVVFVCGLLYMLAGSNLLGFEDTPRYTEVAGGFCICLAALFLIKGRARLAALMFTTSTTLMSVSAFEVLFVRGEGDWFVFLGSIMFYSAGIVAAFIKKEEVIRDEKI